MRPSSSAPSPGVKYLEPNAKAMRAAAAQGFATATDLADWLVRTLGLPFREAHHVTGALVALAEKKNCELANLSLTDMHSINDRITTDVYKVLSVENSVASRVSFGGTSPRNVTREAARWLKLLAK
jgi:argininosuccinate lyase